MTLKLAKEILAEIHVSIRKRDGEYRVNITGTGDTFAYYTDDLDDAVATGKQLAADPMRFQDPSAF